MEPAYRWIARLAEMQTIKRHMVHDAKIERSEENTRELA
jgi:hypothetical protein